MITVKEAIKRHNRLIDQFGGSINKDEQYEFVIAASTGQIRFDEIKSWLENNTSPVS